jgi:hypothetical protein
VYGLLDSLVELLSVGVAVPKNVVEYCPVRADDFFLKVVRPILQARDE